MTPPATPLTREQVEALPVVAGHGVIVGREGLLALVDETTALRAESERLQSALAEATAALSDAKAERSGFKQERDGLRNALVDAHERYDALVAEMAESRRLVAEDYAAFRATEALLTAQLAEARASQSTAAGQNVALLALLKRVQHLADDADQGPRGAKGEGEWRIPWSRVCVEVFADVARALASPAAPPAPSEPTPAPLEVVERLWSPAAPSEPECATCELCDGAKRVATDHGGELGCPACAPSAKEKP